MARETGAYYHVICRIIDRQRLLTDDEKERIRKLVRQVEAFSSIEILTYAVLNSHALFSR